MQVARFLAEAFTTVISIKGNLMMDIRESLFCECCGEVAVTEHISDMPFEYGDGQDRAVLTVRVPVMSCSACGMEYTDERAERIRHDAVCEHLGLLTSEEVRAIRSVVDQTLKEFSEITSIGTASLTRWENGQVLQSAAYDKYLRLLRFKPNLDWLKQNQSERAAARVGTEDVEVKFRAIKVDTLLQARACAFSL